MRNLATTAGINYDETLIKALWLKRLPARFREVLSVMPSDIETLASTADKLHDIVDVRESASCAAIRSATPPRSLEIVEVRAAVEALTKKIEQLATNQLRSQADWSCNQSRQQSRPRTRTRVLRSPQPKSGDKEEESDENKVCFYHRNYGTNAYKCRSP